MKNFDTIKVNWKKSGVVFLTLNRPLLRNAFNGKMISELNMVLNELKTSNTARALIIRANGNCFCAGGDLNWMQDSLHKNKSERTAETLPLSNLLLTLYNLSIPTFAVVEGDVYGGGLGIIAACDFIYALEMVKFALSETRLGLIPATIAPFIISRVGGGHSRELFMCSRGIDAARAKEIGLITQVFCHPTDLSNFLDLDCSAILKSAPGALKETKALHRFLSNTKPNSETSQYTAEVLAERWENSEAEIGINAFLKKEKPPWSI